jgi:uncharacterized protein (DUF433 family)
MENRVTLNNEICHGKPTIRNTRHTVESILEYLAGGDDIDTILNEFKDLQREDIYAALAYASSMIRNKTISKVVN